VTPIHRSTDRWRSAVISEIAKGGYPFPPGLVLAVIDVESQGVAGLLNPKSGASGLMQVMPGSLSWYNRSHALKFTLADMRSKSNGPAQIRVGLWVMGQFWRASHRYLSSRLPVVPIDELARIADLMYAAGGGRIRELLDKLPTPTWDAFVNAYPQSDAIPHPRRVYDRMDMSTLSPDEIMGWIATSVKSSAPAEEKKNWLTAAILTAVIGFFVSQLLKQWNWGE
jgi:hypothetical protein